METDLQIDLSVLSHVEVSRYVTGTADTLRPDGKTISGISIVNVQNKNFVASGANTPTPICVHGPVGDYAISCMRDANVRIEGNTGNFVGHSIRSGVLVVRGHAADGVGAMGSGGLIAIYGNANDRVGIGIQGADIVVRGSVGRLAGYGMRSGTLVIGANAGPMLGHGLRGGTIYLRGDSESTCPDIEEQRLREPDRLKIGLLLLKAGIKSTGKDFRVFRAAERGA